MRQLNLALAFISALALACGGNGGDHREVINPDEIPDGVTVVVETEVSETEVISGTTVSVTCTVLAGEFRVATTTEVEVSGNSGYEQDGLLITFVKLGTYEVACTAPDLDVKDETPVTVTVTGGRPVTVDTVVEPNKITTDETATVRCVGLDDQDNEIEFDYKISVTPSEHTKLEKAEDGYTFSATLAANYQIACGSSDGSIVDTSPAYVRVEAGDLARVKTTLADETIVAGGSTTATCKGYDAYMNEITGADLWIDADPELIVKGATITGQTAGLWDVTCKPKDENDDVELEGAKLKVEAGEPAGLELFMIPSKPAYKLRETAKLGYSLVDAYGNRVPGGSITEPTYMPTEGIEKRDEENYRFLAEGKYVFSACVVDHPTWCHDLEVWCDGTAPLVVIDSPERGATLRGNHQVNVTGSVSDETSLVQQLMVNGVKVPFDAEGNFAHPMNVGIGMNLIEVIATDRFGNEARTLRSFLFSDVWYEQNTGVPADSAIPNSVRAYLDDKLFYNRDPTDEGNLSAILEMILLELDVQALLPQPVAEFDYKLGEPCEYELRIPTITYKDPKVLIPLANGEIPIQIELNDFYMELDVTKKPGGPSACIGDVTGNVTTDTLRVKVRASISVDPTTHKFVISTIGGTTVEFLPELKIHIDVIGGDPLMRALRGTIERIVRDQVQKLLTEKINELDDKINEKLEEPIDLALDDLLPGMNNILLQITIIPEIVDVKKEGVNAELSMAITSPKVVDRTILGSMGRAGCLSGKPEVFEMNVTNPEKIQAAVFEDVLNEFLFAFWNNAGLEFNLTEAGLAEKDIRLSDYGVSDFTLTTYALIPPVITSCNPQNNLNVQIGDLYMELDANILGRPTDVDFFLFLELDAELSVVDDPKKGRAISIKVNQPTLKDMDIVSINREEWGEQDFKEFLLDGLLNIAFEQLKDPFVVAIPRINLKDVAGEPEEGEPQINLPNKDLVIFPESLEQVLGFTYIQADLKVQDPVPK